MLLNGLFGSLIVASRTSKSIFEIFHKSPRSQICATVVNFSWSLAEKKSRNSATMLPPLSPLKNVNPPNYFDLSIANDKNIRPQKIY